MSVIWIIPYLAFGALTRWSFAKIWCILCGGPEPNDWSDGGRVLYLFLWPIHIAIGILLGVAIFVVYVVCATISAALSAASFIGRFIGNLTT